jgi:ABC-2 type transport system permease protein
MGVVGPLVLGTVLALAFGGSGPTLEIGIADLDRSELSSGIVESLVDSLEGSQLRVSELGAEDDLEAAVSDGEVGAVLVFPDGYGESVLARPLALRVVGSGDNTYATDVARGIAEQIADTADLQRGAAAALLAVGRDPAPVIEEGVSPAIRAELVDFEGAFDAPMYFGPLSLFLFLGLGISARTLLRDEHDGILDRMRAAPISLRQLLAGSGGTVMVQGGVAAALVILVSSLLFGAVWGQPGEVAVVVGAFVFSVAGLLGLVVGVARTEIQAESWTNLLAFTFAIIGGSFFGGTLLPGFLGFLGVLTPNGAAMRALIELGPGGRSLVEVWYLLAWLVVVGVAGLLVGGRLLSRRLR